ncbi:MAG: prenyltransferase/squalene oxidase repeat-containing protein [Kiritimatiellia bacterium]
MKRINKRIFSAVACAMVACSVIAENQQAVHAMDRGLHWLKNQQKENGSWGNENYPAMSALGLWAFTRSDHPDKEEICEKAARFVAGFARDDGGIYKPPAGGRGSGGLSTYNTAICMIALHAYDKIKYSGQILRGRGFVASSQLIGDSPGSGGFGYNRPVDDGKGGRKFQGRDRPDLSNTGWSLHAMRVTQGLEDLRKSGQQADVNWDAALSFVEALQNQDKKDAENYGGFGYEQRGARGGTRQDKSGKVRLNGYGSMTYAGLESMIYAQVDRSDPRVRSALKWAARHWSVDENPGMGNKGLYYYYNIMSKSLSLNGSDTIADAGGRTIEWKKELIKKLSAVQNPDGSWVNKDNQFWEGDPVLVTCYAILALEYVLGM